MHVFLVQAPLSSFDGIRLLFFMSLCAEEIIWAPGILTDDLSVTRDLERNDDPSG